MPKVFNVIDIGFGDSGKGATVSALCKKYNADLVVRFSGGAQAAHTVIEGNKKHIFHTYGSGSLQGIPTFLTEHVFFDPVAIYYENLALKKLGITPPPIFVDTDCRVVTDYHKVINRALERARGLDKHGSCGMGIGVTRNAVDKGVVNLRINSMNTKTLESCKAWTYHQLDNLGLSKEEIETDLVSTSVRDILAVYDHLLDEEIVKIVHPALFEFGNATTIVAEGSQGVLLDERHGCWPYVTPSKTTDYNAIETFSQYLKQLDITTVAVMRAYMTRHGAGPFPTERDIALSDPNNCPNEWQGSMRMGMPDIVLWQYALDKLTFPADYLVINHLDEMVETVWGDTKIPVRVNTEGSVFNTDGDVYDSISLKNIEFAYANLLEKPILLTGRGPKLEDRYFQ